MTAQVAESIERVSGIDADEFEREFIERRRPVIVGGLMDDWPGRDRWTPEFFRDSYGDDDVQLRLFNSAGGLGSSYQPAKLGDYIGRFTSPDWDDPKRPPYLSDWDCFANHEELQADFTIPEHFPNWFDGLPERMRRKVPYRFVLIGPAGAVYNLHADFYGTVAWIAQFHGRKRFVVYPPEQADNLSWGAVDPDDPDLEAHPHFADATGRLEGVLEPGEIVYLPPKWFHQVTLLDDSVSIVCNSLTRKNLRDFLGYCRVNRSEATKMMLSLLGLRKRAYYLG